MATVSARMISSYLSSRCLSMTFSAKVTLTFFAMTLTGAYAATLTVSSVATVPVTCYLMQTSLQSCRMTFYSPSLCSSCQFCPLSCRQWSASCCAMPHVTAVFYLQLHSVFFPMAHLSQLSCDHLAEFWFSHSLSCRSVCLLACHETAHVNREVTAALVCLDCATLCATCCVTFPATFLVTCCVTFPVTFFVICCVTFLVICVTYHVTRCAGAWQKDCKNGVVPYFRTSSYCCPLVRGDVKADSHAAHWARSEVCCGVHQHCQPT